MDGCAPRRMSDRYVREMPYTSLETETDSGADGVIIRPYGAASDAN